MSRRIQLRLLASPTMSEQGEHEVIRFPKNTREHFGFSNDMVTLGKGKYQLNLAVKQSYKKDLRRLAVLLQQGKLTDKEAYSVGFVTQRTQRKINRKEGNIWVSEGLGNITVGADPEFGLIGEEEVLSRGDYVLEHDGRFGSDGPGVEVRPDPDQNHLVVVQRIDDILKNPPQAADKFQWKGGATYRDKVRTYWFGGHIHLGRPSQIPGGDAAWEIYRKIGTILDSLLALPMCRFDTPEPHRRRDGCKYEYGKAGDDSRLHRHADRFEYRVLSGLWVVHPTLAKITLGAAKCIAETAYGRIADQKIDLEWVGAPASRKGLLKSFGLTNPRGTNILINKADPKGITPEIIKGWRAKIKKLDLFDDYSEELEALMALATAPSETFSEGLDLDLRKNWQQDQTLLPKAKTTLRRKLEAVEEK
jgi:hypothetical protein